MAEPLMNLNEEFLFFQNLLRDIVSCRIIFKKFECEIKKTQLTECNSMMWLIWYGYTISQLSGFRKFFEYKDNAHCLRSIVRHLKSDDLKKKHQDLFNVWKDKELETVLDKHLLHADKRFDEIKTTVFARDMDLFIDDLEKYVKSIEQNLGIVMDYDYYLSECGSGVNEFFEQIRKVS